MRHVIEKYCGMPFSRNRNKPALPFLSVLSTAVLMSALAGCVAIPKDDHALQPDDMRVATLASDIHLGSDAWPQEQWWTEYGDAQLDALIQQALRGSPSLQAAAARVHAAQAALSLNRAATAPGFSFNAGANQQLYSANGLFPAPIGGTTYREYTMNVQAHYDFDWWGKRRGLIAAAAGEENARQAEYAQTQQSLAAVIASTYFNLQSAWAHEANLQQMAKLQQALLDDRIKRIAHGLATIEDRQHAEAQLSELKRQIAQFDAQAKQDREALRALVGTDDNAMAVLKPAALPAIPHAIPSQLGIGLLARRPDLQAARWRVEASLGRVQSAQAAFYPDINLTGSFGLDSLSLSRLLESASKTYFIGPALSLPIFNSRTLKGGLESARSARNETIADYNQSVLNALSEVSQAGASLQGIEQELSNQGDSLAQNEATLHSVQAKLKQGLVDRAAALNAQMTVLQAKDQRIVLENRRLLSEVALNKALGGGYQAQPAGKETVLTQFTK
jgi:multidrug efflux system outer membrane protein